MSSWKASLAAAAGKSLKADDSPTASKKKSSSSKQPSSRQKKVERAFQPVYTLDELDDDEGGHVILEEEEEGQEEDTEQEEGASEEEEEEGRGARRPHGHGPPGGPSSWADVEADIGPQAEELFDNISRSIREAGQQRGTILDKLFAASSTDSQEVADPLGQGVLDFASKALAGARSMRGRSARYGEGLEGAAAAAVAGVDAGTATRPGAADVADVSPGQAAFSPEAFLGTFHKGTRLSGLRKGVRHLEAELSERHNQLKQLIRENFERFTSCQSTITDIYAKLQQAEGIGVGRKAQQQQQQQPGARGGKDASKAGAGAGGAAGPQPQQQGGIEGLQRAILGLQASARSTWGDVLARAAQADRIRSVCALLARFNNLFGMPARIKVLAAEGALQQVVSEYKRANALIRPTATSASVWVTLHAEIEKRVTEAYTTNKAALLHPQLDADAAPDRIIFLAQLAAQQLPGTRDEDAMRLLLDSTQQLLLEGMAACDMRLTARLRQLRAQLQREPSVRAAALEFAAAWKLQGPTAWQLETVARMDTGEEAEGLEGGLFGRMDASAEHRQRMSDSGTGQQPSKVARDGSDFDEDEEGEDREQEAAGRAGVGRVGAGSGRQGGFAALAGASPSFVGAVGDLGRGSRSLATGSMSSTPAELPQAPSSLEDLALLMWPGRSDWRPEVELMAAMRADLRWRLQASTPRSQLLPEPSFRLAPAQSAWAEYVAELCAVLRGRLPGLWAVAKSDKYAQASDVPTAVYDSMLRAPALARKVVEAAMSAYSARIQVALQALSQAGPLCPAVELVVKELCRTWQALQSSGTTSRALEGVQAAALSAFHLYTTCLGTHLAAAPAMVLEAESWALDVWQLDQQPVTRLPMQLQEEVGLVMFHAGVLSAQCEELDTQATRKAWLPLRDGLFACLASFSSLLHTYAATLHERYQAAIAAAEQQELEGNMAAGQGQLLSAARSYSLRQGSLPPDIAARQLSLDPLAANLLADLQLPTHPQALLAAPTSPRAAAPGMGPASAGSSKPAAGSSKATGPLGSAVPGPRNVGVSAFAAAAGVQGQQGAVVLPSSLGPQARQQPLYKGDEVRVLLLVSNALWLRTRVAPALADTYQPHLAGAAAEEGTEGQGASGCDAAYQQLLEQQLGDVRDATDALLAVFMEHRRQLATTHVQAYISVVCAAGAGSGAPPAVSDACLALLNHLVYAYTLVVSYCARGVVAEVLPDLLLHTAMQLSTSCDALEGAAVYALLQLYVDMCFLQRAWQAAMAPEGQQELTAAVAHIKKLLKQALMAAGNASSGSTIAEPLASLCRAAASGSSKALGKELSAWAQGLLDACMQRTACNIACFTALSDEESAAPATQ